MACCPNGVYPPLIKDCTSATRTLQPNETLRVNQLIVGMDFRVEGNTLTHMVYTDASSTTENIAFLSPSAPNWQSMDRGIFIGDVTTIPTGNPSAGGFMYVESGALKFRGSSGTITTIASA